MRQLRAQRGAEVGGHAGVTKAVVDCRIRAPRWNTIPAHGEAWRPGKAVRDWATKCRHEGFAAERVDLPVSGMTCAACARAIERRLRHCREWSAANVNLATNTATVEFDPAAARAGDFVGAIEDLGYGVPERTGARRRRKRRTGGG